MHLLACFFENAWPEVGQNIHPLIPIQPPLNSARMLLYPFEFHEPFDRFSISTRAGNKPFTLTLYQCPNRSGGQGKALVLKHQSLGTIHFIFNHRAWFRDSIWWKVFNFNFLVGWLMGSYILVVDVVVLKSKWLFRNHLTAYWLGVNNITFETKPSSETLKNFLPLTLRSCGGCFGIGVFASGAARAPKGE